MIIESIYRAFMCRSMLCISDFNGDVFIFLFRPLKGNKQKQISQNKSTIWKHKSKPTWKLLIPTQTRMQTRLKKLQHISRSSKLSKVNLSKLWKPSTWASSKIWATNWQHLLANQILSILWYALNKFDFCFLVFYFKSDFIVIMIFVFITGSSQSTGTGSHF